MKKILSFLLLTALVLGSLCGCAGIGDKRITINVYNWGQYISEGEVDDGYQYIDVIAEFEKANPDIKVNYVTFDSNETMYTKMAGGGITVDVIIPSDYMVDRLIKENMLEELNFDNIPNFQHIDSRFKTDNSYDPENKYSVPYAWGTVGIIYNTNYVDAADVTGWEILWNEDADGNQLLDEEGNPKYAGKILMFDNSRDAFAIAECRLGYGLNTEDPDKLMECAKLLEKQRPVVQQYIMDQVFDLMENEEAWIAPYYAGDYLSMSYENEALEFYLPEHQGFNRFTDAMCIPKCCENKDAAERFINFLCDPEIAGRNMEWISYSSPLSEESGAIEYIGLDEKGMQISYPEAKGEGYKALSDETTRYMDSLFMKVRNGIAPEKNADLSTWILPLVILLIITAAAVVWLILKKRKPKKH